MISIRQVLPVLASISLCVLTANGDTLSLKDGRVLTGTFVARKNGAVWFRYVKDALPTTDLFAEEDVQDLVVTVAPPAENPKVPATAEPPTVPEPKTSSAGDDQKAVPAETREWSMLGRNLSEGYKRAGVAVAKVPSRAELTRLAKSEDPDIRGLARARLGLELLRDRIVTGHNCTSDFEREMWSEAYARMREKLPERFAEGKSFLETYGDPNDIVIGGLSVLEKELHTASVGLYGEKDLRERLRSVLDRRVGDRRIAASDVRCKFRPVKPDDAILGVSNASKIALNHVFIIAQLSMDSAKTDEAAAQQNQPQLAGELLAGWLNASESVEAGRKLIRMRWDYEAIERGSTVYLERWGAGQSVNVGLSPLLNLTVAGHSARFDIYADEGHASVPVSVAEMQEIMRKIANQTAPQRHK